MQSLRCLLFPALTFAVGVFAASASEPTKPTPRELAAEREKYLREIRAAIQGREEEPADRVFKDVQLLKVTADTLLNIMDIGYSQGLGVSCTHCHDPAAWEKNDKRPKEVTREMTRISRIINNELLPRIAKPDGPKPGINCTTCHRGEVKPAMNLPPR